MRRLSLVVSVCVLLLTVPGQGQLLDITPCGDACLPIIFAHPHDGTEYPSGWPARTDGCILSGGSDCSWGDACDGQPLDSANCAARTSRDSFTRTVGAFVEARLTAVTGGKPTVIANLVHRSRLDGNRAEPEAAQDFAPAQAAWTEYTDAITAAVANVTNGRCGAGLLIDMHGQAHSHGLLEMGYALSSTRLAASDSVMNGAPGTYADRSTVRLAADRGAAGSPPLPFSTLLRDTPPHPTVSGSVSMGGLMQDAGWGTIPSPAHPDTTGGLAYFSGGYTTQRWSTRDATPPSSYPIDAMQAEMPQPVRFGNDTVREGFGSALADALVVWLRVHHGSELVGPGACWKAAASPSPTPSPSPASSPLASPTASPGGASPAGEGAGPGGEEPPLALGLGLGLAAVVVVAALVALWLWRSGRCGKDQVGHKAVANPATLTSLPTALHQSPIGERGGHNA